MHLEVFPLKREPRLFRECQSQKNSPEYEFLTDGGSRWNVVDLISKPELEDPYPFKLIENVWPVQG